MPVPAHWRVTFSGEFGGVGGAYEQWSFGVALGAPDGSLGTLPTDGLGNFSNTPQANYTEAVNDLWADAVAFLGGGTSPVRPDARLTQVKLARIGADGLYTSEPTVKIGNQAGGGSGTPIHAPQVSLVATLTTERRGPSGKGRFYLPAPGYGVDAFTGLISAANATSAAAAVKAFITNLNEWPGTEPESSCVVVVPSTKGFLTPVTGVRVGRALDTVRSRRGKLREQYAVSPL